jgi:alkylation response protein AidB-like acyl-CoA dehydrogenase
VNFDFSDDQKALAAEARRFLAAQCPVARVRAVLDDPEVAWDEGLWRAVADLGWLGAAIPDRFGGLGLGRLELCALAEEIGRALAPIPFASSVYLATEAILAGADGDLQAVSLPKLASGEFIGALATAEGPGELRIDRMTARVERGRLTGTKTPVTDGGVATHAVVLALEEGRPGLFWVDLRTPEVRRSNIATIDPTRNAARLQFLGAEAVRLSAAGGAGDLLNRIWDTAAVLLAFEQLGGAERCLEMATDFACDRYAFGRPIGSFQALKHKLADLYVRNQLARSNAYYGAWALDRDPAALPLAASVAQVSASDAYWVASKETIQTFGGLGFTWEVDCHLYYRRSRQLAVELGAPRTWKERVVRAMPQLRG